MNGWASLDVGTVKRSSWATRESILLVRCASAPVRRWGVWKRWVAWRRANPSAMGRRGNPNNGLKAPHC